MHTKCIQIEGENMLTINLTEAEADALFQECISLTQNIPIESTEYSKIITLERCLFS